MGYDEQEFRKRCEDRSITLYKWDKDKRTDINNADNILSAYGDILNGNKDYSFNKGMVERTVEYFNLNILNKG